MKQIREILRLHFDEGRSDRETGTSVGKSASVVHDGVSRFKEGGLPLGRPAHHRYGTVPPAQG